MGTALNISQDLDLDLEEIIGQCIAILGIRGSGKSNTAGVIFEELLRNSYPLSIVDIDGEYFGLKERYEVLVVGHGEGVEIEVDVDCAEEIAQISMEKNIPVVLDLSGFLSDERTEFLKAYLGALWTLAGRLRRPYIIGIEEAHEFIPQGIKTELKELLARVALRGRKRGLGAIIVSQRSAKVDKDVLSQAGMLFLHRVVHEVDMRVYTELLPWRKTQTKELITSLGTGDCVYVNGDSVVPIYVRERATFHAGFTPSLEVVVTPELKQVSQEIIEAIEHAKSGKSKKSRADELEKQLKQVENALADKDKKIERLEEIARTLGYIKVEVPSPAFPDVQNISKAIVHSVEGDGIQSAHRGLERRGTSPAPAQGPHPAWGETDRTMPQVPYIDIEQIERNGDGLPPAVERHLERVVTRIARRGELHRRVLGFVVAHAPIAHSAEQIAAWTNCARGVIESDPPREFLDMGLLACERRSNGVYYRSTLKRYVSREFGVYLPEIGGSDLHRITQSLRSRLAAIGQAD
jgi:DNA-binding transcriptional ArsR family regulator